MSADLIIDRNAEGYRFWNEEGTEQDPKEWQRLGKRIEIDRRLRRRHRLRAPGARDVRGQQLHVARKGGTIVTCASTSGYMRVRQPLPVDEPQADRLVALRQLSGGVGGRPINRGLIHPTLSKVYALDNVGQNASTCRTWGKVGVLTLSPEEGLR